MLYQVMQTRGANFADVVLKIPLGDLRRAFEGAPALQKMLQEKFEEFVLHPDAAPRDVKALADHPVLEDVVLRAFSGKNRDTPAGLRTMRLLQQAKEGSVMSPKKSNIYPYLLPPRGETNSGRPRPNIHPY